MSFPKREGAETMGLVYADVELINGGDLYLQKSGSLKEDEVRRMVVNVLVDSGAEMLVINEHIKGQLGLPVLEERTAQLADESEIRVEVVGPVEIRFENRRSTVDAMVFPGETEPLLGVIPMEGMDVVIDPNQRRLIINPANPYIVRKSVK
jgi:clan AA aspartic protease